MRADLEKHEFIEELINEPVQTYTVSNGCEEGDNVAGNLKKIQVITKKGEFLNIIFKIIPENPPEWIIRGKIFRTENATYRTLVPLLRNFASLQGFNYEPPTPKYFAGFNDDKNDYICLEDVRPTGFIMPDKTKSFTVPEMNLIMRELAKFHAVSHALIVQQGMQIFESGDMKSLNMWTEGTEAEQGYRLLIQTYYEEATKIMKKRNPEVGERMETLVPNVWKMFKNTSSSTNIKLFKTIIHYDLWANNLMIKYENGKPSDVKFIDFQFVHYGNALFDLQYLIFTSTTPEFRKDNLVSSLNTYYDYFSSTLEALKCPQNQFTRGELIDQFYECFLPGFIHMTFAIPLQLGYIGKDPEGDHHQSSGNEMVDAIHRQYLRSPVALSRLDALANELIQMKLI